jgi:hypothetical protein
MAVTLSVLHQNIPVSSHERSHILDNQQQIRTVLLAPPATSVTKWAWFQQDLARTGIASDLLVNRGTVWRENQQYSFLGMKDDLLETLVAARAKFPDDKVVLSTTCLSSIVVALALSEIEKQKLVDGMIVGIPIHSLQHLAQVYNTDYAGLRDIYKRAYGLHIDETDGPKLADISPLQLLSEIDNLVYKPFIYFNQYSSYLREEDTNTFLSAREAGKMTWIIVEWDPKKYGTHKINAENLCKIQDLTIQYMKQI